MMRADTMADTVALSPDPLDLQRARLFALLGRLLLAAPDAALLRGLAALGPGQDAGTPLGAALAALATAAAETTPEEAAREYQDLFIGVGRGELLPFASYYLTGFLQERPLALVRDDLRRLGIERAAGTPEPEDHLGFLCEAMAGMLSGEFAASPKAIAEFYQRHLQPWAPRAFADLGRAAAARLYAAVGALGLATTDIEAAAAELPA